MQQRHAFHDQIGIPISNAARVVGPRDRQQNVGIQGLARIIATGNAQIGRAEPQGHIANAIDAKQNIRMIGAKGSQPWQQPQFSPIRFGDDMNLANALKVEPLRNPFQRRKSCGQIVLDHDQLRGRLQAGPAAQQKICAKIILDCTNPLAKCCGRYAQVFSGGLQAAGAQGQIQRLKRSEMRCDDHLIKFSFNALNIQRCC